MSNAVCAAMIAAGFLFASGGSHERPDVVVIGAKWCGPCRALHKGWTAAKRRTGRAYGWRRWADSYYRISFVDYDALPKKQQRQVRTLPAMWITRRRDGRQVRDGPVSFSVDLKNPVPFFGSYLLEHYPPDDKR